MSYSASRLAFDIETQTNTHRLQLMPPPEVKTGNLKDPVKIAEKEREAIENQAARAALDANFARVVCISCAIRERGQKEPRTWTTFRQPAPCDASEATVDANERALLTWFWDKAAAYEYFLTFNGATFDVPFLIRRSLILGVPSMRIDCHRYRVLERSSQHLDLCAVLHEQESTDSVAYRRNLHFYSRLILGEGPPYGEDLQKANIGAMYDAGNLQAIEQVCRWDAEVLLRLFEAVAPFYC